MDSLNNTRPTFINMTLCEYVVFARIGFIWHPGLLYNMIIYVRQCLALFLPGPYIDDFKHVLDQQKYH